jgi:PhzF family phenazine biosynthesis protein
MEIGLFQVDVFTSELFKGNPAAVCPLFEWLPDRLMQSIAAENNLSATVFIVPQDDDYELRWFTPTKEYEFCGHATLAAAYVLKNLIEVDEKALRFHTKSGLLTVRCQRDIFILDCPAKPFEACEAPSSLIEVLAQIPTEIYSGAQEYMCIYDQEKIIQDLKPDFSKLTALKIPKIIVTAPADTPTYDIVSRVFIPSEGIREDPVTGSAHRMLTPYWVKRLQQSRLHAYQASVRGGELWCELQGDRILLSGRCVVYLKGAINV